MRRLAWNCFMVPIVVPTLSPSAMACTRRTEERGAGWRRRAVGISPIGPSAPSSRPSDAALKPAAAASLGKPAAAAAERGSALEPPARAEAAPQPAARSVSATSRKATGRGVGTVKKAPGKPPAGVATASAPAPPERMEQQPHQWWGERPALQGELPALLQSGRAAEAVALLDQYAVDNAPVALFYRGVAIGQLEGETRAGEGRQTLANSSSPATHPIHTRYTPDTPPATPPDTPPDTPPATHLLPLCFPPLTRSPPRSLPPTPYPRT